MSLSASASKILVVLMALAQMALAIEQRILSKDADAQESASACSDGPTAPSSEPDKNDQPSQESKSGTQVQAAPSLFGDRGVSTPGFARLTQLTASAFELVDELSIHNRLAWMDAPALQLESHWSVRVTASADLSQAPPSIY